MQKGQLDQQLQESVTLWFHRACRHYTVRLADNLQRRAQNLPIAQAKSLLDQHQRINQHHRRALTLFAEHIQHQLDQGRPYQEGTHPQLDRLAKNLRSRGELDDLCRAISPMSVFAGFKDLSDALEIHSDHYDQAVTLFNILVLGELDKLYSQLIEEAPRAVVGNETQQWIRHIESQLVNDQLSAEKRALAERRLGQLRGASGNCVTLTRQQLIALADSMFATTAPLPELSTSMNAKLARLKLQLRDTAIREQRLFTNALHPARRLCRQLVATLAQWDRGTTTARRALEVGVEKFTAALEQRPSISTKELLRVADQLEFACRHFNDAVDDQRTEKRAVASQNKRLDQLRDSIHQLIEHKTAGHALPKSVKEMLLGPWSSVMLYHWLRHGRDSDAAKRCLHFVDDIIWYITPHSDWRDLRRAKGMASQIEHDMLDGMARINMPANLANNIIGDLHQCRLAALTARGNVSSQSAPAS